MRVNRAVNNSVQRVARTVLEVAGIAVSRACNDLRVILFLVVAALLPCRAIAADVLGDYVRAPDGAYNYELVTTVSHPGCTIHVIRMVSQNWRDHSEVDRVLWRHWMAVIVPEGVKGDTAMLIVEGGSVSRSPPDVDNPVVQGAEQIARSTRSVVTVLGQVPNQPLEFRDGAGTLVEDELVAYSWAKAMNTGDYTWPAYVPMVKSVVRAMDTVQDYLAKAANFPIQHFVLVGFSKRGAAAWLTAAVDTRVTALGSGVFDVLDIVDQIERHYEAYGRYAGELHAYLDFNVLRRLRSPEGAELLHVIDPYFYLNRVIQPKLLINATGDPFFLPDAASHYGRALRGETLMRYVPNADHTLRSRKTGVADIVDGLITWYRSLLDDTPRPRIQWKVGSGSLQVQSSPPPQAARLWWAHNSSARDFRKQTVGESWKSTPLTADAEGRIDVSVPVPKRGWRASFVELQYPGIDHRPQVYTTPVVVFPESLPFRLTDPVRKPHDEVFWREQLPRIAGNDMSAATSATGLRSAFPLSLFGARLPDLDSAARVMAEGDDVAAQARRACLAVRLNIAHGDLGWYSRPKLLPDYTRYLWQLFADAEAAYRAQRPAQALNLCRTINHLGE
jgi:PhoPQ-activated pathogenicity-related protein